MVNYNPSTRRTRGYIGKINHDVIKAAGLNFGPCRNVGNCDRSKCVYLHVDDKPNGTQNQKNVKGNIDNNEEGEVLKENLFERILIAGDGYCIINSVRTSLKETHQIDIEKEEILDQIKPKFLEI